MATYICATCGTGYPPAETAPAGCPICEDERQWVPPTGQRWTTLDALRQEHRNRFTPLEPGATGIDTQPRFAIGQRAVLLETPAGNLLWDCISLIDDETVAFIRARGGLTALAISHPHFYSSMVDWSDACGGAPIYLHAADAAWVQRTAPAVRAWSGERCEVLPGLTLIRCGGHFPGSTALHWAAGAEGRGALFTADTLKVTPGCDRVSFLFSFPNLIPLAPAAVRGIASAVAAVPFDRIYGGWAGEVIPANAGTVVQHSADRYIVRAIGGVDNTS